MIRKSLLKFAQNRAPDQVIGGIADPYLLRWYLIPRNRFLNIYVHFFLRSDDDRALHCHPWLFNMSFLLEGEYLEHTIRAGGTHVRTHHRAGDWKFRWWAYPHRLELLTVADFVGSQPENARPIPCWTLFVTGPRVRQWGFHCPRGWVHWKLFTAPEDEGAVGKGCAQ